MTERLGWHGEVKTEKSMIAFVRNRKTKLINQITVCDNIYG